MNESPVGERPFHGLGPDCVLAAVESLGLRADGRLFALNSYENRVYRLGLDEPLQSEQDRPPGVVADALVAKFYRAGRWTDAQIREEHELATQLAEAELPVAAPIAIEGETLHHCGPWRIAVFACRKGGAPDLDEPGARALLGRTLGRIHAIGATRRFVQRRRLADWDGGEQARSDILDSGIIAAPIDAAYARVSEELVHEVQQAFEALQDLGSIRLHGDCHLGNILWSPTGPVFVDLDDSFQGPRVQDLWMFLSGSPDSQRADWAALLEGYENFSSFDFREVALIEALRALRMMNHAAWLTSRWDDPAFPKAFPWFAEGRFWERHVADLSEQLETLRDPPLARL